MRTFLFRYYQRRKKIHASKIDYETFPKTRILEQNFAVYKVNKILLETF